MSMPTFSDLRQMFSREQASFDTWSHSRGSVNGGGRSISSREFQQQQQQQQPGPRRSPPSIPEDQVVANFSGQDGAAHGGGGGVYPPPPYDLRPRHSWDSDVQFPIKEIERIRRKTKKLRNSRNEVHEQKQQETDRAFTVAIHASNGRAGSTDNESSVEWTSPRQRAWNNDAASRNSHIDSLAEVLDDSSADRGTTRSTPTTDAAMMAQQHLMQGFHRRGRYRGTPSPTKDDYRHSHDKRVNISDPTTESTNTSAESSSMERNLALHDLCGEAVSVDDIAWRNALYLLSVEPHLSFVSDEGWTPLHICCLGAQPPPEFMVRALLYCNKAAARQVDDGGRTPLHLVAASSCDVETMQLLVDEYPQGVYQTDEHGLTPLHLLLRNLAVEVTHDRAQVLLGLTLPKEASFEQQRRQQKSIRQRRGEHLNLKLEELEQLRDKAPPVTVFHRDLDHEANFEQYTKDIQSALRRLTQWKHRMMKQDGHPDEAIELDVVSSGRETNPAAIPSPNNMQLPIHSLIYRALIDRTPLEREMESKGSGEYGDEENTPGKNQIPSVRNTYDLIRLFVACYPEGLVFRDSDGHTPLLLTLVQNDCLPTLDIVELLLGKRTAGYESLPSWAQDIPLHRLSDDRYMNPAMIPTPETRQLPLHLAAEELLSDFPLMHTIYDSYPGAINVQDLLGRTPLHIALRSYRKVPVDPAIVSILFSEQVAQIRDDHGRLPFDLLLENAKSLPSRLPRSWGAEVAGVGDENSVYQRFIAASIQANTMPSSPAEANRLLRGLRTLPPWYRKQACSSWLVQELIVDDFAKPGKFAAILLDGVLLVVLITVFRLQMNEFVVARETGEGLSSWNTYAVYTTASLRLVWEVFTWVTAIYFAEFQYMCLFNPWAWMNTIAMLLSIATSVMLYGTSADQELLSLGTATTALLWLSLLGYLSTWSYGVSIFTGCLSKVRQFESWPSNQSLPKFDDLILLLTFFPQIASYLVWPLVIFGGLAVAFAQMFHTLLQIDCTAAFAVTPVCSLRDAYRVVYMLIRGESLVDMQGTAEMSALAIVLVAFFLLFLVVFMIGLVLVILVAASKLDFADVALESFWEHKLAAHFDAVDLGISEIEPKISERSCCDNTSGRLEQVWTLLTVSVTGGTATKKKHWYAGSTSAGWKGWVLSLLAVFLIPIWLVLGALTFGLAWPPQVRRFLFRPIGRSQKKQEHKAAADHTAAQVLRMREDMMQLKILSFERSYDLEKEVMELKDLLYAAIKES